MIWCETDLILFSLAGITGIIHMNKETSFTFKIHIFIERYCFKTYINNKTVKKNENHALL